MEDKMKKLAFLLPIVLGVIIFSSGCDYDLLVQEYEHIQYQGTDLCCV